MSVEPQLYGCQSMTGELRRVLVRAPRDEDQHGWGACGWREEPDVDGIAAEHEAFCALLAGLGYRTYSAGIWAVGRQLRGVEELGEERTSVV